MRDDEVIYVETSMWDGSTGGCGYTDFDFNRNWWPQGDYEVRIFVGDRWLASGQFVVRQSSPTPSATPTRTPVTPSLTPPPTATRTPVPPTATATPSVTRTPVTPTLTATATASRTSVTPTPTATATASRTVAPSPTASLTPSPRPTSNLPPDVYALAVVELTGQSTSARLRLSPPDGTVIAALPAGTSVEMLTEFVEIDNVFWWRVRLEDGRIGWIARGLLRITQPR
jgi:hypothetical protein